MNKSAEARFAEWVGGDEGGLKDWCISRDAPYWRKDVQIQRDIYYRQKVPGFWH